MSQQALDPWIPQAEMQVHLGGPSFQIVAEAAGSGNGSVQRCPATSAQRHVRNHSQQRVCARCTGTTLMSERSQNPG